MTTLLSHDTFHDSVGHAFNELLVLEQMSRLPADSVLRILQSIPKPLLQQALTGLPVQAEVAAPATGLREQRAFPRRKVLRGGRLMQDRPNGTMDVQVRDISEGGCRIGTRDTEAVADRFLLRIVGFEGERMCEVRWRNDQELGVRFLGT